MQYLVHWIISEMCDIFVLVARYACGMFMNKDMRSLWPFYIVSCTVQRRERMLWEQENVATWCDCSLFFLRVHSTRSSTYTYRSITVYIGICSWHGDARSCLWIKKKTLIGDSRRSLASVCSMMNDAFTFLVNKFLWRLRKQSFARNNQYCFINVPKSVYMMSHLIMQWYTCVYAARDILFIYLKIKIITLHKQIHAYAFKDKSYRHCSVKFKARDCSLENMTFTFNR